MKIKCIFNTGEIFMNSNIKSFGISNSTQFGIDIGREYFVMGIILGDNFLSYLINCGNIISDFPCQLFDVIDNKLPNKWYFKAYSSKDKIFPHKQAIWGYFELCADINHYENLIEVEKEAHTIFFQRKEEFEKEAEDLNF